MTEHKKHSKSARRRTEGIQYNLPGGRRTVVCAHGRRPRTLPGSASDPVSSTQFLSKFLYSGVSPGVILLFFSGCLPALTRLWSCFRQQFRYKPGSLWRWRKISYNLLYSVSSNSLISTRPRVCETAFCGSGNVRRCMPARHRRRQPPRPYHADNAPFWRGRRVWSEAEKRVHSWQGRE